MASDLRKRLLRQRSGADYNAAAAAHCVCIATKSCVDGQGLMVVSDVPAHRGNAVVQHFEAQNPPLHVAAYIPNTRTLFIVARLE